MPADRDEDSGRFSREYPRDSFLDALEELDVATTAKVAERVDCSYDLAYHRLNELAKEGSATKREIGGSFVWRLGE